MEALHLQKSQVDHILALLERDETPASVLIRHQIAKSREARVTRFRRRPDPNSPTAA